MCALTKQAVKNNPELALYGFVFNSERTGSFTRESIERELGATESGPAIIPVLGKCLRNWLEDELLYRSYDGYRIA